MTLDYSRSSPHSQKARRLKKNKTFRFILEQKQARKMSKKRTTEADSLNQSGGMGCDTKRCKEKRLVMEAVWTAQQCLQSADRSQITHISQCHHQSQQYTVPTYPYLCLPVMVFWLFWSNLQKITMCHLMLLTHQKYSLISIKLTVTIIFVFANADYQ